MKHMPPAPVNERTLADVAAGNNHHLKLIPPFIRGSSGSPRSSFFKTGTKDDKDDTHF